MHFSSCQTIARWRGSAAGVKISANSSGTLFPYRDIRRIAVMRSAICYRARRPVVPGPVTPLNQYERSISLKASARKWRTVPAGRAVGLSMRGRSCWILDGRAPTYLLMDRHRRHGSGLGRGRVAQPFGFRPHRSGRAAFPHPALPEGNPRHIRACAQVRVMRGTGRRKRAVRVSNSDQPMRRLF